MKVYRISRPFLWLVNVVKFGLTLAGAGAYVAAVTHPTPFPARVALLAALAVLGWVFYVRLPRIPTEVGVTPDGWVHFRGRRGAMRVHAASIRSIKRSLGHRTVKLRYNGGRLRMPNRVTNFYDFLATVKGFNPAIEVRGF